MEEVVYRLIEEDHDVGQRLDNFLVKILKGVPKSHIYRIIRAGEVRVNKKRAKPDQRLQVLDLVRIPPIRTTEKATKTLPLSDAMRAQLQAAILFEDEGLMVLNKPAGMAVHGGSGVRWGLIESMRHWRTDIKYLELVHRLDRETSGCLLLAKKKSVLRDLQQQWQQQKVKKIYWAIGQHTWVGKKQVTVTAALHKNILKSGERMVVVSPAGKPAISHIQLVKNALTQCWLQISIETGRTHQIRVHCAYIGHPILGDVKYTTSSEHDTKVSRLFLHAQKLKFYYQDQLRTFEAPMDAAFQEEIQKFSSEKI